MGSEPGVVQAILDCLDPASVTRLGERKARQYIGTSSIGNECDAYQALTLRGFPNNDVPGRMLRIFQTGHIMESEVVKDLKAAGVDIMEENPSTGRQWEYSALGGHLRCHLDGIASISDTDYVLEIKTMNKARFAAFKKHGVKLSDPKYYAQCQMAMQLSGLTKSLFVALCKDNSEYHAEIVEKDVVEVEKLVDRALRATQRKVFRITSHEKAFGCKMCFKSDACWRGRRDEPAADCAKCAHSVPYLNFDYKQWHCSLKRQRATDVCSDFEWFTPA